LFRAPNGLRALFGLFEKRAHNFSESLSGGDQLFNDFPADRSPSVRIFRFVVFLGSFTLLSWIARKLMYIPSLRPMKVIADEWSFIIPINLDALCLRRPEG
jgi:hypothetical protein